MARIDFVIAGAGIIGLSLALELQARGARVVVLEARHALRQTSFQAAGMLAAEDPANPPALAPLARLSVELYPAYLDRIAALTGQRVPFQTSSTLQAITREAELSQALPHARDLVPELAPDHPPVRLLHEHSVDPRQLAAALLAAVQAGDAGPHAIELLEETAMRRTQTSADAVRIATSGPVFEAAAIIDCMGTWSPAPVAPRKGQMLLVRLPGDCELEAVVRTDDVYIVPRTEGPNAGHALIGATLEDVGFDTAVNPRDLLALNARASALLPVLARATFADSWAGLRPNTSDGLPLLGATARQPRYVLATGHYRNGILLAPATAQLVAQLLLGEQPTLDLAPFAPDRQALHGA